MRRFENKNILVTGGTSGMGLATVNRLVEEGATVLVTGRNQEKLKELNNQEGIHAIANDAAIAEDAIKLGASVEEYLEGQLDGVFLNAGYGGFAPVGEISVADFEKMMNVNVRGPLLQLNVLSPMIKEGGSILFNSSIVNDMKMPGAAVYAATKGAVRSAMQSVSAEMAPRGIRVNAVSPGPIDTGFMSATGLPEESIDEFNGQIKSQVPLGRMGKAEEMAGAVTFLLSDDASFVHAEELVVDGGMS